VKGSGSRMFLGNADRIKFRICSTTETTHIAFSNTRKHVRSVRTVRNSLARVRGSNRIKILSPGNLIQGTQAVVGELLAVSC
jgi:hypothetical protein